MERCENCGRVITTHNINLTQMLTKICKTCQDEMSGLDFWLTYSKTKSDREKRELDAWRNSVPERRNREPEVWYPPEPEKPKVKGYAQEIRERDERIEGQIEWLEMGRKLIDRAEEHGVEPHSFSRNGICMFCGQHVDDCFEHDQFICE